MNRCAEHALAVSREEYRRIRDLEFQITNAARESYDELARFLMLRLGNSWRPGDRVNIEIAVESR